MLEKNTKIYKIQRDAFSPLSINSLNRQLLLIFSIQWTLESVSGGTSWQERLHPRVIRGVTYHGGVLGGESIPVNTKTLTLKSNSLVKNPNFCLGGLLKYTRKVYRVPLQNHMTCCTPADAWHIVLANKMSNTYA